MTSYCIKVILCSALFFIVYKLLFENEKMLQFNRFYLLFCLVFSFVVPLVTLQTHSPVLPTVETNVLNTEAINTFSNSQATVSVSENNSLPFVAFSVYLIITTLLLLRFCINLKTLFSRILNDPVIAYHNAKLVLIDNNVTPHSFLNYIFINREDYNNGKTENEILIHELTHVQQKHSVDVLFIELIQAIIWFNPVFMLYRKAIQLNHEFLADERVVKTFDNSSQYQRLLIDKVSKQNTLYLTSQFNYSVTKKRLIMMTKSTSRRRALCRQIALMPLLVAAIFIFSIKTIAQENRQKTEQQEVQSTKEGVSQELLNEYRAIANKNKLNNHWTDTASPIAMEDKKRLETIFFAMDEEQQAKQTVTFEHPTPFSKSKLTEEQFKAFKNSKKYALNIDDKKVDNTELNKYYPSDFAYFAVFYRAKKNRDYGKHLPLDVFLATKKYSEAFAKKISAGEADNIMITRTFKKAAEK